MRHAGGRARAAPAGRPHGPDPRRRRRAELEPDPPAPRRRRTEPEPATRPRSARPVAPRYTFALLGVQAVLVVLGLSCLLGAFFKEGWNPPEWSYFHENPLILLGVGIALLIGGWTAQRLPVLTTLMVVVGVLLACSWNYIHADEVDASRVIALALSMLALWLALQHRRAAA